MQSAESHSERETVTLSLGKEVVEYNDTSLDEIF